MYEIGAKMFDNHGFVCHLLCHKKMTNADVAGPLGSWSPTLYECHTTQIDLVDKHWTNGISLLLYSTLQVDSLSRGFGEANKLSFRA